MSVHKLKDGRWIVRYQKGSNKKDPGRTREYFGRGLEAEKKARQRNESLNLRPWERGTPKPSSPFFYQLFDAYIESRYKHIQKSTKDNMIWKMAGVILPEIGAIPAISLTEHRLDQYVKKRLKSVKRTTVHREISDIQAVLNWAVKKKYLTFNPLINYGKPDRNDDIIRPPSIDEILSIIQEAPSHLIRAICISYYTGIRPGNRELYSRKWHDVDFENQTIFVISARKGGRMKSRNIPLHPDLLTLLYIWQADDRRFSYRKNKPMPEFVIHYKGKKIKSVKTAFKKAKIAAGISRRIRLYDLRHAFASGILKRHGDLKSVSETLGHSRTETTTRIYQHTDTEMHRNNIRLVPSIDILKIKNNIKGKID